MLKITSFWRRFSAWTGTMACGFSAVSARANPAGGAVAQGAATFNTSGARLTIQTSDRAFINWQSFNIGAGETTTFVQPSSSSLVWNQIHDANPSQILGNLNANGFVVLQNQSGFYIGGLASIATHGLIMTTAPIPMPDLSSGSAWQFDAAPPAASIINYGQINVAGGNPAFLIAHDIQNAGIISAPGGSIGLYAGKEVLLSERPDGRGLSAAVTMPEGSVDNSGKLVADAGTIALHAQVVNQGGLIQANSAREVGGVIELVAGESLNMGASSRIAATGDGSGVSSGGSVTLKSGGKFHDDVGSMIDVSGSVAGGNGGQVEISAPQINSLLSSIDGHAIAGFQAGKLLIDPQNIVLAAFGDNAPSSGTVNAGDPASAGSPDTLTLNVNSLNNLISQNLLSQISLQAVQDIEVGTLWKLPDSQNPNASLSLTAGRNITLDNGAAIQAGQNWTVNLNAGPMNLASRPASGTDGIYLNGSSFIQTQNGNINLYAANEVQVATGLSDFVVNNGIRTLAGGNITVTTDFGDVNSGNNPAGYIYSTGLTLGKVTKPFYTVSPVVGGISTAAGGSVTIKAGGNVTSYLPSGSAAAQAADGGIGAFGSQPGNVSITAGGSIFGHYVLANGTGTMTAGGNFGDSFGDNPFALSLINGAWNINAPAGNIYLQEVRNPNGLFNNLGSATAPGHFLFNYDPQSALSLTAAVGVYLTDLNVPRPFAAIPVIYPPTLSINAGSGGVVLEGNVTLFPSAYGNLNITTTAGGNLQTATSTPQATPPELLMSDSAQKQWQSDTTFTDVDHGAALAELNNPNPVWLNISGNMANLTLITTKQTQIDVSGNMINCGFSGQNLHANETTSITVGGQIFNQSAYSFVLLSQSIPPLPAANLPGGSPNTWDEIFNLALNPAAIAGLTVPQGAAALLPSQLAGYAFQNAPLFTSSATSINANPGFIYNSKTGQLGFAGQMSQATLAALTQPLVVLRYGANGFPVLDSTRHFVTDTVNWASAAAVQALFQASLGAPSPNSGQLGYRIGGPGQFDVTANSISLGNTYGILSSGVADPQGGFNRYNNLASVTPIGATLNVKTTGNLDMLTSTIAAIGGGDVNLTSTAGSMDLGSEDLFNTSRQVGFGVFTSGRGDVNVTAFGDINIDGSRIAAYNGGNINIKSLTGDVNAGSGGATITGVGVSYVDPVTGLAGFYAEDVFGSGVVANTLVNPSQVPGSSSQPGNIAINTPQGNINADQGGIIQEALNGNVASGPSISLTAGTLPSGQSPGHVGNINLGDSGVIGGTINASANGNISGLVISRQSSTVVAQQSFTGTVLSGGSANVSATAGSVSGTVIGVGGANVSGGQGVTASVLGQNVSVQGASATSTLGTASSASVAANSAAGTANSDAKDQTLGSPATQNDEDLKKKKLPLLSRLVGRVTVILPK